jgi:phosphoglucosamine mutase
VSALQILAALQQSGRGLAEQVAELKIYPQTLKNVAVPKGFDYRSCLSIQAALVRAEVELEKRGRVLLRPSGTEPVIRVMVEADDPALAEHWAARLADEVATAAHV